MVSPGSSPRVGGSAIAPQELELKQTLAPSKEAVTEAPPKDHTVSGERTAMREAVASAAAPEAAQRAFIRQTLGRYIRQGLQQTENGRAAHHHHMEEVRGVTGLVSDWMADVLPPYQGMWGHPKRHFERAQAALDSGDYETALRQYESGAQLLGEAKYAWASYLDQSIEGAGLNADRFRYVRDASVTAVAGMVTAGAAYVAAGGGVAAAALATGVGAAEAAATGSALSGQFGDEVRGALDETAQAGLRHNLALARAGLVGMFMGLGAGLDGAVKGAISLPSTVDSGLRATVRKLKQVFQDPTQLQADLAKLPVLLNELNESRHDLAQAFATLPPEKQAEAIGKFAGHIESMLVMAEMGNSALGGLKDVTPPQIRVNVRLRHLATSSGAVVPQLDIAVEVGASAAGAAQAAGKTKLPGTILGTLSFSKSYSSSTPSEGLKQGSLPQRLRNKLKRISNNPNTMEPWSRTGVQVNFETKLTPGTPSVSNVHLDVLN